MSGQHTRYQYLLRQRLTATAMNTQSDYNARLSYLALESMTAGDATAVSGVVNGLLVTIPGGSMNVTVGGGLAILHDNAIALPDSKHRWIEVQHSAPITVTLDVGDASPRWDAIEIEPGQVDGTPEIIDFYDPSLGAAVPLAASPLKVCTPTVTVTKGTPSGSPKFPAGTAGRIPLAYIYVPAGAVTLTTSDVVYCRPILKNRAHELTPGTIDYLQNHQIRGGGLDVAVAGLNASVATDFSGFFERAGVPFYLPRGSLVELNVTNYDGGGLPLANDVVYCYAVPWPYPAGYDVTLAPREFTPRAYARLNEVGALQRNCFYFWSSVAPIVSVKGTPNAGGSASINHPNIGAISIPYDDAIYVGAAFFELATTDLMVQTVNDTWVAPERKTGFDFEPDLPIAAASTYNLWTNISGDAVMELPITARQCELRAMFDLDAAGYFYMRLEDDWTSSASLAQLDVMHTNQGISTRRGGGSYRVNASSVGNITIPLAAASLIDGNMRFHVAAYEDAILAKR